MVRSGKHLGAARTWLQWNTNIESKPGWHWGDEKFTVTLTLDQIDQLATAIANRLEQDNKQ